MKPQLRQALLSTNLFESNEAAKAIFFDPRLRPWRDYLPEADSRAARVDRLIAFLEDRQSRDEPPLAIFLHASAEPIDPGDASDPQLLALAAALAEQKHVVANNPYRGLFSSTEADSSRFYGRQEVVAELFDNVEHKPAFVAVIGSSGSENLL